MHGDLAGCAHDGTRDGKAKYRFLGHEARQAAVVIEEVGEHERIGVRHMIRRNDDARVERSIHPQVLGTTPISAGEQHERTTQQGETESIRRRHVNPRTQFHPPHHVTTFRTFALTTRTPHPSVDIVARRRRTGGDDCVSPC